MDVSTLPLADYISALNPAGPIELVVDARDADVLGQMMLTVLEDRLHRQLHLTCYWTEELPPLRPLAIVSSRKYTEVTPGIVPVLSIVLVPYSATAMEVASAIRRTRFARQSSQPHCILAQEGLLDYRLDELENELKGIPADALSAVNLPRLSNYLRPYRVAVPTLVRNRRILRFGA